MGWRIKIHKLVCLSDYEILQKYYRNTVKGSIHYKVEENGAYYFYCHSNHIKYRGWQLIVKDIKNLSKYAPPISMEEITEEEALYYIENYDMLKELIS